MLTGDVKEQLLWIFTGSGANGKSVVLGTLLSLFGDYGRKATQDLFMHKEFESRGVAVALDPVGAVV